MLLIQRQLLRTSVNCVFPSTKLTMGASLSRWHGCSTYRSMTPPTLRSLYDVHSRWLRPINACFKRRRPSESRFSDDWFHLQLVGSNLVTESFRYSGGTVPQLLTESPTPSATVGSPVADGSHPPTRNCADPPAHCRDRPARALRGATRFRDKSLF